MSRAAARVPVLVPTTAALVFDAEHGWHLLEAPPAWWIENRLADVEEPAPGPVAYLPDRGARADGGA